MTSGDSIDDNVAPQSSKISRKVREKNAPAKSIWMLYRDVDYFYTGMVRKL